MGFLHWLSAQTAITINKFDVTVKLCQKLIFLDMKFPMLARLHSSFLLTTCGFLLLASVGCQHEVASKLAGRWDMLPPNEIPSESKQNTQREAVASSEKALDDTEDLYDSVAGGEVTGTMSLVFHRNGQLETYTDFPMASTGKPKIGKWSILSWDAAEKVATVRCDLFDEITETKITFIDDNTIQLIPPNIAVLEMELRFRRN